MKKKLITIATLVMVLVLTGNLAYADSQDEAVYEILEELGTWEPIITEDADFALVNETTGEMISEAWSYNENGNKIEIDLLEYAEMLNESNRIYAEMEALNRESLEVLNQVSTEDISSTNIPLFNYRFSRESTQRNVLERGGPVTPYFTGPATMLVQDTHSINISFSAGLTAGAQSAIRADAGITINNSSSSTVGGQFPLEANQRGRVWFQPSVDIVTGTVTRRNGLITIATFPNVSVRVPRRLNNGHADGHFSTRYTIRQGWQRSAEGHWYFRNNFEIHRGWQQDGGDWFFLGIINGRMVTGKHRAPIHSSGAGPTDWFFFNNSGRMQRNIWVRDGANWHYFGSSGQMQRGWVDDGTGWFYIRNNILGLGIMQTCWQQIGGSWFYLGSNGRMRTGRQLIRTSTSNATLTWNCFNSSGRWTGRC